MEHSLLEIRKKRAFEAGFILYGLVWFLLSFVTNSNLAIMFLATLPILIGLIILIILIESDFINMTAISLTPIIISAVFYTLWKSGSLLICFLSRFGIKYKRLKAQFPEHDNPLLFP
jgi:thiol:disulfide interchange protein